METIKNIAKRVGYYPNWAARSLNNQKTDAIGIITNISEADCLPVINGLH